MEKNSLKNLIRRVLYKVKTSLPEFATFEISQRCNLNCNFCYLGSKKNIGSDISIDRIFNIIDQLEKMGIIKIILSGGEPLIRKDFELIYKYIKKKGFLITIFTNGTLITSQIADLFKKYPPHHLRISLYAGSNEGYEKISGNPNAFEKIKKGIELLKKRGIYFTFWSLITKINFEEFEKMKKFAESLEVRFWARTRISTSATRKFNPRKFKITPEQQDILARYSEKYIPMKWEEKSQKRVRMEGCNGCFFISSNGHLLACPLYRKWYSYDLKKISLRKAWGKRLKRDIKLKCPSLRSGIG